MAISLFSLKKSPTQKVTSFIDPTKFGGPFSGGRKPLKSEAAEARIASKEVQELSYIRKALETLVSIEKRHYELVTDSIKQFALSEQKRQAREEESMQESSKDKDKIKKENSNPLVREGKKRLESVFDFFQNLVKIFIGYKILDWTSKPENGKKIQNVINFFGRLFKFISVIGKGIALAFGATPIGIVLNNLPKAFDLVIKVVGAIADFITFKWLGESIQNVAKLIGDSINVLKIIPDSIGRVINFVTNLIPNFIENVLTEGLFGSKKQLQQELDQSENKDVAKSSADTGGASEAPQIDFGKVFGDSIKGVASKVLENVIPGGKAISDIGKGISGLFGGDKDLPKLAKGGIVTRPTQAIVGEAGPEAILPLDKLGSFGIADFKGQVNKQVPKFIKLLTLPFKIIGAGIVALISSSVSSIPGLGPLLMPLISNVASMFGVPPSLVKGMSDFAATAVSAVGKGMSGISDIFGSKEPKIQKTDDFKPSGDTSVRGLLGDILTALISKNSSTTTPTQTPTAPPGSSAGSPTSAPAGSSGSPAMPANATMAKAGDSAVQNLEGTVRDLQGKGYKYVNNTANRFFQDSQGRLYQATRTGSTLANGDVFKLQAVSQDQIDKGFTSPGSQKTTGSKNNQEIQRQLELFRIINEGGILRKQTTGTKTQTKKDGKWADKGGPIGGSGIGDKISILAEPGEYMLNRNAARAMGGPKVLDQINHGMYPRFGTGGPVSTRKFLKLGGGWAPVPEDSKGVVMGRGLEHGYTARDLPMPVGTPLLAPFDGKVHEINKNPGGWGNYIVLKSNSGIFSLFGHVSSYTKKQGDAIKAGEQVASSGHQHGGGRSTGPHLHWEIGSSWNGTIGGKVEPIAWTKGQGVPSVTGQTSSTASTDATASSQPDFTAIASSLGKLFNMMNTSGQPEVSEQPKMAPSISSTSQRLQSTQTENFKMEAEKKASAKKSSGNVVSIGNPNRTIAESNSMPLPQPLGGTTPPTPLTLFPVNP